MGKHKPYLLCCLLFALSIQAMGQQHPPDSINKTRLNTFLIGTGAAYTVSLIALNEAWYADHPKEPFHFFNDAKEWKQMDKIGHIYSTYQLSRVTAKGFEWSGMNAKKSAIWGSIMGFAMTVPIELLDGYSSAYGASGTDILADALGSGVFLGQMLTWGDVRIHMKYSYSKSGLAEMRPDVLGKNGKEQWLKDYNGQTYWLSFDLHKLVSVKPKWLNIGLGYGVNNMINANGQPTDTFTQEAYRQYYLALDIDLTHIKSKSKFLNSMLFLVNMIHLPSPALEFNRIQGVTFHPLQF